MAQAKQALEKTLDLESVLAKAQELWARLDKRNLTQEELKKERLAEDNEASDQDFGEYGRLFNIIANRDSFIVKDGLRRIILEYPEHEDEICKRLGIEDGEIDFLYEYTASEYAATTLLCAYDYDDEGEKNIQAIPERYEAAIELIKEIVKTGVPTREIAERLGTTVDSFFKDELQTEDGRKMHAIAETALSDFNDNIECWLTPRTAAKPSI